MRRPLAAAVTVALSAGAVTACGDDSSSSASDVGEAEAQTVDLGDGREMWIECLGEGEPTIILESGIHDASDYWTVSQLMPPAVDPPVMQGLAETNRVCRYDRPGTIVPGEPPQITDRSTSVENPRTIGDSVDDLRRLLEGADVPGPYVLVAHSWGGMIAQLYARTYPDDVSALVLVDAFAPAVRDLLGDKWDAYVEVLNNPPGSDDQSNDPAYEKFDVDASVQQVLDAPPLPELPLVVLTKTEPFPEFPEGAGMTNDDIDGVWPAAQQSLVDLLPNTPQMIAHGSFHYIPVTEPDLGIDPTRLAIGRIPRDPAD
ncbi:MAG: alpha/beta fold hydrolase [Ilumatobacteraceae bacterium]